MRHVRARMYMRYLNRDAKDQKQRTENRKGDFPWLSRVIFDRFRHHLYNYNVPIYPEAELACIASKGKSARAKRRYYALYRREVD